MSTPVPRDGVAEMSPDDQRRMTRRAIVFDGVKKAAQYAGLRPERFMLLPSGAAPPPSSRTKRLYLLRHGEGVHNAWRAAEQAAGRTPTAKRHNVGHYPVELHDPCLTEKGLADATAAASAAAFLPRPELLVTSPMRRAIQTLLVAFGDAASAGVPIIAHELCREAFHGTDPSIYDSRLSRDELAAAYPNVDFSSHVLPAQSAAEDGSSSAIEDPLWWHCVSPFATHESGTHGIDEAAIAEHAHRFLTWLMARPESVIAVATHSNFLLALYHACLDGVPDAPQVFFTGELRQLLVCSSPAWACSPTTVRASLGAGASQCFAEPMVVQSGPLA